MSAMEIEDKNAKESAAANIVTTSSESESLSRSQSVSSDVSVQRFLQSDEEVSSHGDTSSSDVASLTSSSASPVAALPSSGSDTSSDESASRVRYYNGIRSLPVEGAISYIHSLPEEGFHFYRIHKDVLMQIKDVHISYVTVNKSYSSFSFVDHISQDKLFKYAIFSNFLPQKIALLGAFAEDFTAPNLTASNKVFLLLAQLIPNFQRTKNAPFRAAPVFKVFLDNDGDYNNKYSTAEETLDSCKDMIFEVKSGKIVLIDSLSIKYQVESHVSFFDLILDRPGWNNFKWGKATLESIYRACTFFSYILSQFLIYQKLQIILVSEFVFASFLDLVELPVNSAIIFFDKPFAFRNGAGRQLGPANVKQVVVVFGVRREFLHVKVRDNGFRLPHYLTLERHATLLQSCLKSRTIIGAMRKFEIVLTSEMHNFEQRAYHFTSKLFEFVKGHPPPRLHFDYDKLKSYHNDLHPYYSTFLRFFPSLQAKQRLEVANFRIFPSKKELCRIRKSAQSAKCCYYCKRKHHLKECLFYPQNYKPFNAYTQALCDHFDSLKALDVPQFGPNPSVEQFDLLRRVLTVRDKFFWASFKRKYPIISRSPFVPLSYVNLLPSAGFLYAIGVPTWNFRLVVTGLFLPFMEEPVPFHITSPTTPSEEESWEKLKSIKLRVAQGQLLPISKKYAHCISQEFVINSFESDISARARIITNLVLLNGYFPEYQFHLQTPAQVLHDLAKNALIFPFDLKSAYKILFIHPKYHKYLVIEIKLFGHTFYFANLVAVFGLCFLCVLFNRFMQSTLSCFVPAGIYSRIFFDNGLMCLNAHEPTDKYKKAYGDMCCWIFYKLRWRLNPDYPPQITSCPTFCGSILDAHNRVMMPKLSRFWKFMNKLHIIFETFTISCQQAASLAGMLQSFSSFNLLHRIYARYFHAFIFEHFGQISWADAEHFATRKWRAQFPIPLYLLDILEEWALYLTEFPTLQRAFAFKCELLIEMYSDGNPKTGSASLWIHDKCVRTMVCIIPARHSKSSTRFESYTIEQGLHSFGSFLHRHRESNTMLTVNTDNRPTVSRLKKGNIRVSNNHLIKSIVEKLHIIGLDFRIHWRPRDAAKIAFSDSAGRLPDVSVFNEQSEFWQFLTAKFPQKSIIHLTSSHEKLQKLRFFDMPFLEKFRAVPQIQFIGPLFDCNYLNELIPKLHNFKQPLILLLPKFQYNKYWRYLCQHRICREKVPFKFYHLHTTKTVLRYPLFLFYFQLSPSSEA